MKDINAARLAILRELKNVRRFFDMMESGVKSRDPEKIEAAYFFLKSLVYHMNEGDLTPDSVALAKYLWKDYIKNGDTTNNNNNKET